MIIETIGDARTLVGNSGVVDWAWGFDKVTDAEIVDEKLPEFIFRNAGGDVDGVQFNELVQKFIKDAGRHPDDYFDFSEVLV